MQKIILLWQTRQWMFMLAAFMLLVSLVVAINGSGSLEAQGANERVITVYDKGNEVTFVTNATTVRNALNKLDINVTPQDSVEPALDTKLVARNYHVNVYRARPVLVVDGERRETILSPYKSAKQIVEKAGVDLYTEDIAEVERVDDVLIDGTAAQKVIIDRAIPLKLELYGKTADIRTQARTVGDIMKEKGVVLAQQDVSSHPLDQPVVSGMELKIWRNGIQTLTEEKVIDAPVRTIRNSDKDVGFREVQAPGKPGKRTVTYEINMQNGREVSRKEIQNVVTEQPQEEVIVIGTKRRGGDPASNRLLGRQMMLEAGFPDSNWTCLDSLWTKESGWNQYADNPSSDAYGIPQALPGTKMGIGWESDPEVQIRWGLGYIKGRYGTPCGAWNAFKLKGWY